METIGEFSLKRICDEYTEEIKNKSTGSFAWYGDTVVQPSDCVVNLNFRRIARNIQDFQVYPDDTWVFGFLRSGTNWTEEMVWLLVNNLDFEKAKSANLKSRFPRIETEKIAPNAAEETFHYAATLRRPRCIKSYFPVQILPKALWSVRPKMIYVVRDPRDVAISLYQIIRLTSGYTGTFEDFAKVFLADRVLFAPYWSHVLGFHKLKDQFDILINTYEEMKSDLKRVIKKTANYLNVSISDEDVERLRQHLSFKNMKVNPSCNKTRFVQKMKKHWKKENDDDLDFIRKGESGNWEKIFTSDLKDKFDEWIEKHLKGTQFDNPWN